MFSQAVMRNCNLVALRDGKKSVGFGLCYAARHYQPKTIFLFVWTLIITSFFWGGGDFWGLKLNNLTTRWALLFAWILFQYLSRQADTDMYWLWSLRNPLCYWNFVSVMLLLRVLLQSFNLPFFIHYTCEYF